MTVNLSLDCYEIALSVTSLLEVVELFNHLNLGIMYSIMKVFR